MNCNQQYCVSRLTKSGKFAGFARFVRLKNKKAGVKPAFPSISIGMVSIPRDHRACPVEAIVYADLDRMLVVAEGAERRQGDRGDKLAVAEVVILILDLG